MALSLRTIRTTCRSPPTATKVSAPRIVPIERYNYPRDGPQYYAPHRFGPLVSYRLILTAMSHGKFYSAAVGLSVPELDDSPKIGKALVPRMHTSILHFFEGGQPVRKQGHAFDCEACHKTSGSRPCANFTCFFLT